MFDRFSGPARRAVVMAHDEARTFSQEVGTQHLLLGLVGVQGGIATQALESVGISSLSLYKCAEDSIRESVSTQGHIGFSVKVRDIFKRSVEEAQHLGQSTVGTGHILLALIQDNDDLTVRIIACAGVEPNRIGQALIERLKTETEEIASATGRSRILSHMSGPHPTYATSEHMPTLETVKQLRSEVARLEALLRQHNIDPHNHDGNTADSV